MLERASPSRLLAPRPLAPSTPPPTLLPWSAEDDECISRDYVDGFHLPTHGDKGSRHMDIVRRMDALAACIEPLTKV